MDGILDLPPIAYMIERVEEHILIEKGVAVKIVLNEEDISNELQRLEIAYKRVPSRFRII